jgi:D-alanyl-D-alanine carboxypeptidase (penicillin-binding protein 5/6)
MMVLALAPGAPPAVASSAPTGAKTTSTTATTPTTTPGPPGPTPTTIPQGPGGIPEPAPAAAEILVDVDTGRVLFEFNAHDPLPPGSLTKTLTAMIAVDWLPPAAEIPVTAVAAQVYPDRIGMQPGELWPLGDTLHALITASANDAAYALAIDIGGSLAGFAPIMSEAAAQLGFTDHPVLEDPAGLDRTEGFDGGNRISAWDLAISGRDLMAIPELAAIAGQETYDFEGPNNVAYHLVSLNYHFLSTYPGAIGVKTGFTDAAGFCDMEEAVRNGRHILAVVLDSPNPVDADADAGFLITDGFADPVKAEASDPRLPPVRRPEPPGRSPAPTTTASSPSRSGPATPGARRADAAAVAAPARGGGYGWVADIAVPAVAVVAGGWWLRRRRARRAIFRRRAERAVFRRRPAHQPAHRRRRSR